MADITSGRGPARNHDRIAGRSRFESIMKWILRFLLPVAILLGALLFYWVFVDDAAALAIWKVTGAVPLAITCSAVALWAWEVWQPTNPPDKGN
jgi:hypothetical protein